MTYQLVRHHFLLPSRSDASPFGSKSRDYIIQNKLAEPLSDPGEYVQKR
jgi:hypothetical protein